MKPRRSFVLHAFSVLVALAASACAGDNERESGSPPATGELSGTVHADGSSTVAPFARHAAELFERENPPVRVTVAISGTGGGFKRFCAGETDISNASRPIAEDEELACRAQGVDYHEFPIANDAVTLIANKQNDWTKCLTTKQLERIWQPGSRINRWDQVDQSFPGLKLRLFGPDTESGTFDFFTARINRESGASRLDYTSSRDDRITVGKVARNKGGLGYLGFTYYQANRRLLRAIAVDGGEGCVVPSLRTVQNGTYKQLSRPLYVYVNTTSFERPGVREFVRFMLTDVDVPLIALVARLVPLTERQKAQVERAFTRAVS